MLIKRGMTGPLVASLQQNLTDLGYDLGSVDGAFGKNTEAAVKDFQSKKGLGSDGIVGAKTLQALDEALKAAGKEGAEFDDQPEEAPPVLKEVSVKLGWVTCPADKVPGKDGYGSTVLRGQLARRRGDVSWRAPRLVLRSWPGPLQDIHALYRPGVRHVSGDRPAEHGN